MASLIQSQLHAGSFLPPHTPPKHLGLKIVDFIDKYCEAIVSYEFFVFSVYIKNHPAAKNKNLMLLLPSYLLFQWSVGQFDQDIYDLSSVNLKIRPQSLKQWAATMRDFESEFQKLGIANPIAWLYDHKLIRPILGGLSWEKTGAVRDVLRSPNPQ